MGYIYIYISVTGKTCTIIPQNISEIKININSWHFVIQLNISETI